MGIGVATSRRRNITRGAPPSACFPDRGGEGNVRGARGPRTTRARCNSILTVSSEYQMSPSASGPCCDQPGGSAAGGGGGGDDDGFAKAAECTAAGLTPATGSACLVITPEGSALA